MKQKKISEKEKDNHIHNSLLLLHFISNDSRFQDFDLIFITMLSNTCTLVHFNEICSLLVKMDVTKLNDSLPVENKSSIRTKLTLNNIHKIVLYLLCICFQDLYY